MAEASDFFLTDKELRDRFEEDVRDFVFSRYTPQEQPVLVLLGGQPAAGKTQAMKAARQRYADRQLVPLTGDKLRPYHPRHEEILENEPWLFPNATGQASGAWVRMSIEYARDHRYSLMLEGVFRDPAMTLATAEEFAGLGYRVEVVGLGVRAERSRLDSLNRFLEGGRWTPPDLHDLAYRMMPETTHRPADQLRSSQSATGGPQARSTERSWRQHAITARVPGAVCGRGGHPGGDARPGGGLAAGGA